MVDLVFANGRVMKGIYALAGDTLLVAINTSLGGQRPSAFNSLSAQDTPQFVRILTPWTRCSERARTKAIPRGAPAALQPVHDHVRGRRG